MAEKTALFAPMAESEGKDHSGGESGRFANEAEGGFEIGDGGVEEADAVDVAHFFLEFFLAAKLEDGAAAGFLGGHACGDIFFGELVDMEAEFGVHLRVGSALLKNGFPPGHGKLLLRGLNDIGHRTGQAIPVRFFTFQLLAAL